MILLASCSSHGDGAQTNSQSSNTASASSVKTLMDELRPDDSNSLVFLNDVHLAKSSTDAALYAVGRDGHRIMLITSSNKQLLDPTSESVFDVFGTIKNAPSLTTARHYLRLPKPEATILVKDGFYIEPTSIVREQNSAE
jgi:hypothetical protein